LIAFATNDLTKRLKRPVELRHGRYNEQSNPKPLVMVKKVEDVAGSLAASPEEQMADFKSKITQPKWRKAEPAITIKSYTLK